MNVVKLKDCCTIIAGQSPESKYYNTDGQGIPFFQGKADFGDVYPAIRVFCSKPTKIAEKDDILLSVRAPVGPTNLSPGRVCIGRGLTAIRPSKILNLKYLLHYFRYFEARLQQKGTGTTFKAITQDVVKNLEVPIPSLEEQHRIVARIEELFSELDNGVETLQKTEQQLTVYRQAVLKQAFDRAGKTELSLKQIIEKPCYGTSKKCSYDLDEASVPVYRIPNINYLQGLISHDDLKYAAFTEDEFDSLRLCSGDILIIRSNGSISLVGRSAVVTEKDTHGLFAGYLMRLRIKNHREMLPQYLNLYLNTHNARYQIEQMAKSTSGVNNINSDEICRISVPVCDLDLQKAIIQEIEARLSVCDSIEKTVDTALQQAEAMRQSILKQAFEGKL